MNMKEMKPVVIGTVGAGYAAHLHGNGYEKVNRVPIRLKGICDMQIDLAEKVKERYGYEYTCTDYKVLLEDPEINVIDIASPDISERRARRTSERPCRRLRCTAPASRRWTS